MKRTNIISINNTDIYYEKHGKGIPILIVHGWSVDHNLMSGSMERIFHKDNRNFQRIYIDLPGMGKSSVNPLVNTADDVLDILLSFIDLIIQNKKFLLVGESWGGYLSRGVLKYKHMNILGLCLLCPSPISGEKNKIVPSRTILKKDNKFLSTLSKVERDSFDFMAVVQTKKTWKKYKKDIFYTLLNNNHEYLDKILDGSFTKIDFTEKLSFDKPVLLLTGRQDQAVGYKDQMTMFMDFPRATIVVLDKAGHNLQIEQEEVFHSLVTDWLRRVKTY